MRSLTRVLPCMILLMAAVPAAASPANINADKFYQTARVLLDKGMGAMFDKRTKPAMAQMKDAGAAARLDNEAATRRGAPLFCVPAAARKKGLDAKSAIAMLGSLPAQRRQALSLKQAWREVLIRDYPCR